MVESGLSLVIVGTLNADELKALNGAVFVFLGLSETAAPGN